jgi:cytochrome c6
MGLKKILAAIVLTIALCVVSFARPAEAADVAVGAKVFSANCAACHLKGNNIVMANKNLKKEALSQYGMNSPEAIITQVTNGKGAMPSFKGKLNSDEIESVAAYVLAQSEKGWK